MEEILTARYEVPLKSSNCAPAVFQRTQLYGRMKPIAKER